MPPEAIIFDFDGVLIESEFEGNVALADLLTRMGHSTSPSEAVQHYTGLAGKDFVEAVQSRIGQKLPPEFHDVIRGFRDRALEQGIAAVTGAIDFVRSLSPELPKAVASSSSTRWVRSHLRHIGLEGLFEPHIYSGSEHVIHGKPAPDLYLHAARELRVDIRNAVIIEDSKVGAKGALASGARVIGLAAGRHCFDGHEAMLRSVGVDEVATSFEQLKQFLGKSD
jgi:beta-phosphoglucomutase-like phosphatase (HAD superfamily)